MPMIDVYAPANLFPADADERLGTELTHAVLRAEGHHEEIIAPFFTNNTAAFVHRLPVVSTGCPAERPGRACAGHNPAQLARPRRSAPADP